MANGVASTATVLDTEFHRGLGLYDSTMVVVGSMMGSGIFIVSADLARNIGSPGWLPAAWLLTGVLTVVGALKTGALAGLIVVGLLLGWNHAAVADNFGNLWTVRGAVDIVPGLSAVTAFGLFVAVCVSQTGSLFSADAWNNITFTAGEVKDPRRNVPLSLVLGATAVIGLYLLANLTYLVTLPLTAIQPAPGDRVARAPPA